MKLNEWLKRKMEEEGMTRQELAEALGVSYTAVYKYLNGTLEPGIRHIKKLSQLFNTPESKLLAMKGIPIDTSASNEPTERDQLEAELRELAKSFDRVLFDQFVDATGQLDEDAMRDVIKFMRFLIEKEKEGKE